MHKLFVYGTLQRRYWNHKRAMADKGEVQFLGETQTTEKFVMAASGIPFIFRRGQFHGTERKLLKSFLGPIAGEVFLIDDAVLKACDALEGHPYSYRRELVAVKDHGTVWAYFYQKPWRFTQPHNVFVKPDKDGVVTWGEPVDA